MAYYRVCPGCNSNLDPGEKCSCMENKARQQDYLARHMRVAKSGQLAFVFDGAKAVRKGERR